MRVGNQSAMSSHVVKYSLDALAKSNVRNNLLKKHTSVKSDYEQLSAKIKELEGMNGKL